MKCHIRHYRGLPPRFALPEMDNVSGCGAIVRRRYCSEGIAHCPAIVALRRWGAGFRDCAPRDVAVAATMDTRAKPPPPPPPSTPPRRFATPETGTESPT
ncbi:hypothetical protein M758_UG322700 [Ceratodon purpureus]|nr:hypothetical protein M758_UG322700 [Ceratodon purpureus]